MNETSSARDGGLAAFASVDFDWTRQLQSVWRDWTYHVDALNKSQADILMSDFIHRTRELNAAPINQVIVGGAGSGKTHLVGNLRKQVWEKNGWFVLLDLVDVKEFWPSTIQGFVDSLHREMPDGMFQYQAITKKLLSKLRDDPKVAKFIKALCGNEVRINKEILDTLLPLIASRSKREAREHQDVFRALLLLNSSDWNEANIGFSWLQGIEIPLEQAGIFGFSLKRKPPKEIVRGLSWIMSLTGPTMIAVDQIDAIVSEYNLRSGVAKDEGRDDEELKARSIIESLAAGLMELHDVKQRAIIIIACLEATWTILQEKTIKSATQRFRTDTFLKGDWGKKKQRKSLSETDSQRHMQNMALSPLMLRGRLKR